MKALASRLTSLFFLIVGFSLSKWMIDNGVPATPELPLYLAAKLMNDVGISIYLQENECDSTQVPFNKSSNVCTSGNLNCNKRIFFFLFFYFSKKENALSRALILTGIFLRSLKVAVIKAEKNSRKMMPMLNTLQGH